MLNKIADIQLAPKGGFTGWGPLGNPSGSGIELFSGIISKAIGIMTLIGVIWFIFLLIGGAYGIMTSGGDKAQLEAARKRITSGVVGLVIIISAVFILDFFGFLVQIPFLDIGTLFGQINQ